MKGIEKLYPTMNFSETLLETLPLKKPKDPETIP